jgi:hypothetical protein
MAHTKTSQQKWYNLGIVVEILIHETERGEKYAPEIGNLCVGFSSLTPEKLEEEINNLRSFWPFVFPKNISTKDILTMVKKRYPAYEELLVSKDQE